MADIAYLTLLYEDFQMLQIIDPDKFDKNYADIKTKINEMIAVLNTDVTGLATHKSSSDHDARYYIKTDVDTLLLNQYNILNGFINTHKTSADHDSRYYTEAEIDVKTTNLQSQITTNLNNLITHKTSNDHDGRYYTETELDAGQLDNRYYTEAEINSFLALKSNDNVVVKISGNQSIDGIKTFTSSPIIPTPISDMQTSTKKYVDDNINTLQSLITNGVNNLNTHKSSSDHDSRYYSKTEIDNMTFKLSGNQIISGIKTFNSSPIVPNPINELDTANKIYVDSVCTGITQGAIADGSMTDVKLSDLDGQIKQRVSDVVQTVQDATSLIIAGGTGTNITLSIPSISNYVDYKKYSFIATASNNGNATTVKINNLTAIPLYKPNTTTAPNIVSGKAYEIWNVGGSFFLKASAEGDAVTGQVLAGSTFSNDSDTGLTGTMVDRSSADQATVSLNGTATLCRLYLQPPTGYYGNRAVYVDDPDFIASNIKAGVNIFGLVGNFTSDANAVATDLLATKTAYVGATKITGSMVNRGAVAITPSTTAQAITAGYHNGSGSVAGDADLVASNIKNGTDIFGVVGTFASDATAVAGDILASKTAYSGANKLTGTMADRGTINITPSTVNQIISAGKHSGTGVVYGDTDLVAGNIKLGTQIFGVNGTVVDGSNMKKYATGQMNVSTGYYTVTGLTFIPRIIWIKNDSSIYSGLVVNTDQHPQAAVLNGNVYKETTITGSSFSIYNNIMSGSTTWYAFE